MSSLIDRKLEEYRSMLEYQVNIYQNPHIVNLFMNRSNIVVNNNEDIFEFKLKSNNADNIKTLIKYINILEKMKQ